MARNAYQGNQRAELRQMMQRMRDLLREQQRMPQAVAQSAMTIRSRSVNG